MVEAEAGDGTVEAGPIAAGPQATSSQRAPGSDGTSSTIVPSASAESIAGARAKASVWRVNSSRIESSYIGSC